MDTAEGPIGWIGAGRMGVELASRLLDAGFGLRVWNRTKSKAAPLAALGAEIVDAPTDLADCDLVVTIVSSSEVFEQVMLGEGGLLSRAGVAPAVVVDASTVSVESSAQVRAEASERGTALLAAPVSGNPKVARSGRLSVVVSGPDDAYERARPVLEHFGQNVTYVGDGDRARLVKICHNLFLGIVAQGLAETAVLAERGGVARSLYLDFLNNSVMGSVFSRYKTPAFVNLDYTPTFTSHLLRKDFELGLEAARKLDVTLPVSALVHQLITALSNSELADGDFAALIELAARSAGVELKPEGIEVSDGLASTGDQEA
jgi:3-hydroxyisobutyrate dehydrogenase